MISSSQDPFHSVFDLDARTPPPTTRDLPSTSPFGSDLSYHSSPQMRSEQHLLSSPIPAFDQIPQEPLLVSFASGAAATEEPPKKRGRGGSKKGRARKHNSCEPCRKKKVKCDRFQSCSNCLVRGHFCYYSGLATPLMRPGTMPLPASHRTVFNPNERVGMSERAELERLRRKEHLFQQVINRYHNDRYQTAIPQEDKNLLSMPETYMVPARYVNMDHVVHPQHVSERPQPFVVDYYPPGFSYAETTGLPPQQGPAYPHTFYEYDSSDGTSEFESTLPMPYYPTAPIPTTFS